MKGRCFYLHDNAMSGQYGGITRWQRHLTHAGASTGEALDGRRGVLLGLGIGMVTKKVRQHAETRWRVCLLHGQAVIANWQCQGAGVMAIVSGDGLEH